jgi:hypothetical protein
MIHSLEDKNKKELVEICKIQTEEYQALVKQFDYVVDLYEFRLDTAEKQRKVFLAALSGVEYPIDMLVADMREAGVHLGDPSEV